MDYDIVIVGAGVSGLLSALALSKEGKKVLVLEKSDFVGGNCRSYDVDGYTVDTGVHAITHVDNGPLPKLINRYFDYVPKFVPFGDYLVRTPEKLTPFPWTMQAWVNFDILPKKDRMTITSLLGQSVAFKVFGAIDTNQSIYDFLKKNDFSEKTWKFIDILSYFMSGRSMHETPVWRLLKGARYREETEAATFQERLRNSMRSFKKLVNYDGSYHQAYPTAGVGSITDCILRSMPKDRVDIKTSTYVSNLAQDGDDWIVSAGDETFGCNDVIYSGFMSSLPTIVEGLEDDFKKSVESLKHTASITTWIGLEKPLKEFKYHGSEIWFGFDGTSHYWGMPTSNFNKFLAPKGKQLVGFTAIHSGDPKESEKKLLEAVFSAIPAVEDHIEMKHTQTTIPEKAAITVGSQFPGQKSSLEGLYLVGTDTDTRSMGVTRAGFSVLNLLEILKHEKKISLK